MTEKEDLPFCKCGCGERVSKKGNKFIHGHNCGNQGKKHPGMNIKPEIREFIRDNTNKHLCHCGCGEYVEIKEHHFTIGIPEFIHGHNRKKADVIRVCEKCGKEFIIKGNNSQVSKKFCSDKCRYEHQTDTMKGNHRVDRITVFCEYCGVEFKIRESESDRRFCCHRCYTNWYSENLIGEANSKWTGGQPAQDARRRELGYQPLNDKFPGSDGHHITRTLVIYIPGKLHEHISHNLRTGKNMAEINMLAVQYLYGCYDDGNTE